jgi:hypothetical protein
MALPMLPLAVWKDSSVAPQANSILSKRNWRSSLSSVLLMTPLLHSIQVLPSLFTVAFSFFLLINKTLFWDKLGPPAPERPDAFEITGQKKRPDTTWSVHMMRYPKLAYLNNR